MPIIKAEPWKIIKSKHNSDPSRPKSVSTGDHKASRGWGPNRNPSGDRSEQANSLKSRNPSKGSAKVGGQSPNFWPSNRNKSGDHKANTIHKSGPKNQKSVYKGK